MKKILLLIACLTCFFTHSMVAEYTFDDCDHEEFVIDSDQILVTEEGLFVILDGELVPIHVIEAANGEYRPKTDWTCPICETVNPFWRTRCKKCKY